MIRYSLLALVVLVATAAQGHSREAQHKLKHCRNPDPRYKRVEDFTVKWFQDNILEKVLNTYASEERNSLAPFDNALFYTRNMSEEARKYACKERLITVWEPWHEDLYNESTDPKNLYSCIHHNNATRNTFFERMSEAFATKAAGFVHVMHHPDDYDKPPTNGIWGRIEQKALRDRVYVKRIGKLKGTDKTTIKIIWNRVIDWVEDHYSTYNPEQSELRKRGKPAHADEDEDMEPAYSHCALPVYTLPVDW